MVRSMPCRQKEGMIWVVTLSRSSRVLVSYTETHAGVGVGTDDGLDVPQSVVAAVRALFANPDGTERQVQVVHQHEHVLHGDLLLLKPVPHGVAGEVHIRGGFEQYHFGVLHATFGYEPVTLVLPFCLD